MCIRDSVPDVLVNLCAGKDQTPVFHEVFDDLIFHRRQRYLLVVHRHPLGPVVERKAAVDVFGRAFLGGRPRKPEVMIAAEL